MPFPEFRVVTTSYTGVTARTSGSVINAVGKLGGTNAPPREAPTSFERDKIVDAKKFLRTGPPGLSSFSTAFNLWRDGRADTENRTLLFANYEGNPAVASQKLPAALAIRRGSIGQVVHGAHGHPSDRMVDQESFLYRSVSAPNAGLNPELSATPAPSTQASQPDGELPRDAVSIQTFRKQKKTSVTHLSVR